MHFGSLKLTKTNRQFFREACFSRIKSSIFGFIKIKKSFEKSNFEISKICEILPFFEQSLVQKKVP